MLYTWELCGPDSRPLCQVILVNACWLGYSWANKLPNRSWGSCPEAFINSNVIQKQLCKQTPERINSLLSSSASPVPKPPSFEKDPKLGDIVKSLRYILGQPWNSQPNKDDFVLLSLCMLIYHNWQKLSWKKKNAFLMLLVSVLETQHLFACQSLALRLWQ